MVWFAYHLLTIFFYDGDYEFDWFKIVDLVLATQNNLGRYGIKSNSSACEDIDSIDILLRAFPYVKRSQQDKINSSLRRAFKWVTANQVTDGRFVFRLYEPFYIWWRPNEERNKSRRNDAYLVQNLQPVILIRTF